MPENQTCPSCGGARGTDKVEASVELDEQGQLVPKQRSVWSPCGLCHGQGTVVVG
ncbi:hypothetical protein [Kitasatospora sp. NPDC050543]|uniref:hypothetical protein n=1 Tax=Kitasatospora sp. NPDC050543 TaxID=3364054 RepID=UPI0037937C51